MKQFSIEAIRNVCLLGHGGCGKTSLAEAMLYHAGASERFGKVVEGTTVTDYDPEEIKRKISINAAVATFPWKNVKMNVIDTPGYFDFVGEVAQALRVSDAAVIVLSGKSGLTVGAEKAWDYCEENGIAKLFFINKVDDERVNFPAVLEQLRDKYGKKIAPFQIPIKDGDWIVGFVDVVGMVGKKFDGDNLVDIEIPADMDDSVAPAREMILEAVAESDDALMEKYFAGEEFTEEEIRKALRRGIKTGDIVPVFCGSAVRRLGANILLDAIEKYSPSPDESVALTDEGEEILPDPAADPVLFVYKTVADPFVGKISFFRVLSGEIKPDTTLVNSRTGANEKLGKIFTTCGKKQTDIDKLSAGDLGAVNKLAGTKTGDTLCKAGHVVSAEPISFPAPVLSLAVVPKAKGDEEKINGGLQKLMEEDPTIRMETNLETHQQLLSGVGEQHLDVIVSKLKTKFGVDVELIEPKTPYRETIRKKVKVEGKHKKQSGGHGQYGHVWIEFEPGETEGLTFEEKVFGGAVPKNYFPAVEKGLQECIPNGVLAGYPVVFLKATLLDGSYHPVDSSEMAFKMAAHLAFKSGLEQANPVLLEPVGSLKVTVPESLMGDIIGDINKRRGRVLGMSPTEKGLGEVTAEVPMSEMHKYATDLRSMTQGRCSFSFTFERYEEAPSNIAAKVIEASKKDA